MQKKHENLNEQLNRFAVITMHINMIYNMQFMQEHEISFTHLNSLFFIHRAGCTNIHFLANHLGVTKAAVSQMVDRLVESGLISREEDPIDRRSKLICLSKNGEELVQQAFLTRRKWVPDLTASLSETQAQQACEIFEIMNEKLKDIQEGLNPEVSRNQLC
jgi:MarR family transcriptional regulator for hemolysin